MSNDITVALIGNRLLFKSFALARQIFDLSEYYREATEDDVTAFINSKNISVNEDLFGVNADSWVRRKLAMINDSGVLNSDPTDIARSAKEYGVDIELVLEEGESKIAVPDEKKSMKALLKYLDEDFYTGPISAAKYVANSKRQLR